MAILTHKRRVYLDTSVISALFDERNPERQSLTRDFFKRIDEFDAVISALTRAEIGATPDSNLRDAMFGCVESLHTVEATDGVEPLVDLLLSHDAVPRAFAEDALHIALAIGTCQ